MNEIIDSITEELLQENTTKAIKDSRSQLRNVYEHMIKLHSVKNNLQCSDWIDSIRDSRNEIIDNRNAKGITGNFDKALIADQDAIFKDGLKRANSASDMIHKEINSMYPKRPEDWTYENIMNKEWMTKFIEDNIVSDECEDKFNGFGRDIEYRGEGKKNKKKK